VLVLGQVSNQCSQLGKFARSGSGDRDTGINDNLDKALLMEISQMGAIAILNDSQNL
jgi:hypothetical protein